MDLSDFKLMQQGFEELKSINDNLGDLACTMKKILTHIEIIALNIDQPEK